jgi:hypothetical protein
LPAVIERFTVVADEYGMVVGELLERALDGLAPSFSRQRRTFDPDLFRLRIMPPAASLVAYPGRGCMGTGYVAGLVIEPRGRMALVR